LVPASGAGCVPNQFGMDQTINPMVKSRAATVRMDDSIDWPV
jgi:hypothetical protein